MHIIDECQTSIKETSYDKHNKQYMVESQMQVCNFDEVKNWYISNYIPMANPNPKSNDALYCCEDNIFFIEFKNGGIDNKINFEINKKIYDSLFILFDLKYQDKQGNVVDSIAYTRKNMEYILVYNEKIDAINRPTNQTLQGVQRQKESEKISNYSKHRTNIYKGVRGLANKELIL